MLKSASLAILKTFVLKERSVTPQTEIMASARLTANQMLIAVTGRPARKMENARETTAP